MSYRPRNSSVPSLHFVVVKLSLIPSQTLLLPPLFVFRKYFTLNIPNQIPMHKPNKRNSNVQAEFCKNLDLQNVDRFAMPILVGVLSR
jgi:hypothetical protein